MPPPYKLNVIVTNCPDIGGTVGNYDVQLVRWGHAHARPSFLIRTVSPQFSNKDEASVTPSGLFPSDLKRPVGSSLEGTWNIFRLIKPICTMSTGLLQPGLARVKEGLGEPGKRLYTACEIHSFNQITIYSRLCTSSILSCRGSDIEEDLNRIFQEKKMWYPG